MTAFANHPHRQTLLRQGFTLTELLVVIAIIVLLVTLLLAALAGVQTRARRTSTLATMSNFANACLVFQQDHGFYPGIVPERILAAQADGGLSDDNTIMGTENVLLHLMGGAIRRSEVTLDQWNTDYPEPDWQVYALEDPDNPGEDYLIKVNIDLIGDGPIIRGQQYQPYFTPSEKEFGIVLGQLGDEDQEQTMPDPIGLRRRLPDLIDAWGQPIVCLRRTRSVGPIVSAVDADRPQFNPWPMTQYTESFKLGRMRTDQRFVSSNPDGSILDLNEAPWVQNMAFILAHPAMADFSTDPMSGQTRGAIMLLSSGPDGIYFSAQDGAGSKGDPVETIDNAKVVEEYDDVLMFSGD
jgi:prepilin-type N-terminal cleavage/methylation domain-containing protein